MNKLLSGAMLSVVSITSLISTAPVVAREVGEIEVHRSSGHTISSESNTTVVSSTSSHRQRRRGRDNASVSSRSGRRDGSQVLSSDSSARDVRQEDRREDRREDRGLEVEVHRSSGH